jgi:hypothetical protein
MPLPLQAPRRGYHYDLLAVLKSLGSPKAATTSEPGVAFPVRFLDVGRLVIHYSQIAGTVNAINNWIIAVEVSDTIGGTYTEIARSSALPARGQNVELVINGARAQTANFIRVTAIKLGTPGDLTYGAYIAPC